MNALPHQTAERLRTWADARERRNGAPPSGHGSTGTELLRRAAAELDLIEPIRALRNEVDCRIEHGAESGGHLDYVRGKLDAILYGEESS